MSAQIINLHAWRVAHSERPALCLELLRAWPVRVWLAWLGNAVMDRVLNCVGSTRPRA